MHRPLLAPLLLLLIASAPPRAAAPLSVVNSISDLWGGVAFEAAEVGRARLRRRLRPEPRSGR
jgi:hypothetical protein